MSEIQLLVDFHQAGERQGPGSPEETRKALALIGFDEKEYLKAADIGCGTGAQTITLAQQINGHITAIDLFPEFLERLDQRARELGLSNKITTRKQSMDELQFGEGELDLIWSEGAIYNIGFETGIKQWRRFLKTGGYLAVSELSWISGSRPAELEQYWQEAYPEIDTVSNKIGALERNGYTPVAHFILPPNCWIDHYFRPMQQRFPQFLEQHNYADAVKAFIENEQQEIRMYEQYKDYYSYGFYIARKG